MDAEFRRRWVEATLAATRAHAFGKSIPRAAGVYVALANDYPFFKLGSTQDLRARATALRWVMPGGMRLLMWWEVDDWSRREAVRALETDLQARLHQWLDRGEWFRATPESLALVESWREQLPAPVDVPSDISPYAWKRRRKWLVAHHDRGAA